MTDLRGMLLAQQASGGEIAEFGEHWSQGRSAFGGLSAAFAVNGMRQQLDEPLPMRSLMVSFIAPLPPGEVQVRSKKLRQGKNVTQCQAELYSGDKLCLQAMGVFGHSREALSVEVTQSVAMLSRDDVIPFGAHARRMPPFLAAFEGGWVGGGMPYSGDGQLHLNLWARHRADMSGFAAEALVAMADIPPPVILNQFSQPLVPASSLSWALEFPVPPEEIGADWLYLDFQVEAASAGYTQQSGRLFDPSGRLCALSRQTMVYFG